MLCRFTLPLSNNGRVKLVSSVSLLVLSRLYPQISFIGVFVIFIEIFIALSEAEPCVFLCLNSGWNLRDRAREAKLGKTYSLLLIRH